MTGLTRRLAAGSAVVAFIAAACSSDSATVTAPAAPPSGSLPATTTTMSWVEEDVAFTFDGDELFGVLTLPTSEGPHPAVVIVSGSGDQSTGTRDGVSNRSYTDHGRRMALEGFAVLRYDPPGIGSSAGESGLPSVEARSDETLAALRYLQSRPDISPDEVGMWGESQGPWVIAMTAARFPQDVAFLISVVGSGQSVANQQIYGIEAQSRAAGLADEDISKAVLFGRLLVDWQLIDPIFQEVNETDAQALGDGPWTSFVELVYDPGDVGPVEGLSVGIEILKSVQDEPWTEALYLKQLHIPRLESIPPDIQPEQLAALQATTAQNLMMDPKDFLTKVTSPVLAFFGEDDLNVDTETSSALYRQYLTEAGNENFTIVVIPGTGHAVGMSTPGYWDTLSDWLNRLYPE